ncbi:hypothetical protein F0L68_40395 [Solihabitans fulvus]|uniref:Uncharacterized protein n=1 Tax=Solihabitans fulvus TaxID=1892852 RepID=A0A5B2W8X4_9PSEU|nr:hypothetical protein [Solihabitans fulvus]KAA2247180.1 hypothetical protein F0L68_40395 [Solihabitans fulvus]
MSTDQREGHANEDCGTEETAGYVRCLICDEVYDVMPGERFACPNDVPADPDHDPYGASAAGPLISVNPKA